MEPQPVLAITLYRRARNAQCYKRFSCPSYHTAIVTSDHLPSAQLCLVPAKLRQSMMVLLIRMRIFGPTKVQTVRPVTSGNLTHRVMKLALRSPATKTKIGASRAQNGIAAVSGSEAAAL